MTLAEFDTVFAGCGTMSELEGAVAAVLRLVPALTERVHAAFGDGDLHALAVWQRVQAEALAGGCSGTSR